MERVEGIGGFFFTADYPEGLAAWYADHLGVLPPPTSYDGDVWTQRAGPTVVAAFGRDAAGSPMIGRASWGINFRVRNLDAMVDQLRAAGTDVVVDDEEYPNGRFAHLHDPEGNAIQLWEPDGPGA